MGPWKSCPLPGARTVGKISVSVPPPLAAVRIREALSPFWLLSLGLKSPPECYPTPALAPSLDPCLLFRGSGTQDLPGGKTATVLLFFLRASPLPAPTSTQQPLLCQLPLTPASLGSYIPLPRTPQPDFSPGAPD